MSERKEEERKSDTLRERESDSEDRAGGVRQTQRGGERRVVAQVVKAVPPDTTIGGGVTEKEKETEFNLVYTLLSHTHTFPNKIKTILDSGANETMINNFSFAKTIEQQKTGIQTAGKNSEIHRGIERVFLSCV